ncbi:RadC family protein [Gudongella sp. DL1XJH-153]|uniref:RadC family protein n=1 Tax=Gudongella sp. DL1XJH-153 TaxID=3409804 RepID=UPI003BB71255
MLNYETMSNKNLLKLALSENNEKILESITEYFGSLSGILINSGPEELENFGLPRHKIEQIKAYREIARRLYEAKVYKGVRITSPEVVYDLLKNKQMHQEVETFSVVLLDTKNQVIDIVEISKGTINQAIVHPRDVFKLAIRRNSARLILSHPHPSGDATPSSEDISVTKRLVDAGNIIGIKVVDHVIIGNGSYVSLKELGEI